jgi:hypothetical protein
MDPSPLVTDEIDAGAEFLQRLHASRPVTAACWLREADDEERYLYAAIDGLTVDNSGAAYVEVLRIANAMKDHYIDPFRVKLIGPDHPVAQAVRDVYLRYPGRIPTRFPGRVFAGGTAAEVYIYPPVGGPAPADVPAGSWPSP